MAKSNYPIYWGFALLTIINFIYISIEIIKPSVLESLGYDFTETSVYQVTHAEIRQISAIANYSLLFETAFIILAIVCMLLFFTKRFRPFFTSLMIMTFSLLSLLFILDVVLAMIFDAPQGNLTQLLIVPFQFLMAACIYGHLKFRKKID